MSKIKIKCCYCNKEVEKYLSSIKDINNVYCSKECYHKNKTNLVEQIAFTCECCGETFYRTKRQIKNAESKNHAIKYCSKKCKSDSWGKNRIEVSCFICGKKHLRQEKDVHEHNFCSSKCYSQYKEDLFETRTCEECNNDFLVEKSYIKTQAMRNQQIRFCSKQCHINHIRKDMVETTCSICGKTFLKNKNKLNDNYDECCSLKCKQQMFKQKHRVINKCRYCGKEVESNKYANKKFCNMDCRRSYIEKVKDEYKEVSHYLRTHTLYDTWRNEILKRDHYHCKECGSPNELHVHHIKTLYDITLKYNFNIETILASIEFNDLDNGITLCTNCHAKQHPFIQRDHKGRFCRLRSTPIRSPKIINAELSGEAVKSKDR